MRETVNKLRAQGKKVGLVKARSFRPFPDEEIAEALKNVKSFAVMDKDDSFIHNAFEDVGATMFGAETAYKVMKKRGKIDETWKLITFGGDGGTYDIGFQALSGAMERDSDMVYMCYGNKRHTCTPARRF